MSVFPTGTLYLVLVKIGKVVQYVSGDLGGLVCVAIHDFSLDSFFALTCKRVQILLRFHL